MCFVNSARVLFLAYYTYMTTPNVNLVGELRNCQQFEIVDVCPNENVTFWLYTSTNVTPYRLLENNHENLLGAPFVPNKPVKFLIHGYTGHRDFDPNPQIRPEYLKLDYNVISIDYGRVTVEPCYVQSVRNVPVISKCASLFILSLFEARRDIEPESFHVVGFSLGGQVAGKIGAMLRKSYFNLRRITGLDPAGPLFVFKSLLTKRSALFVDVIHTNAGLKGKLSPAGHVDFYLNKGAIQTGCELNFSCSHARAPECFAESISTKLGFYARKLFSRDVILMGEHVPLNSSGIYYARTNSKPPYAMGKRGLI